MEVLLGTRLLEAGGRQVEVAVESRMMVAGARCADLVDAGGRQVQV